MQIAKNKVATFDYTLTNNKGEILDSSENHGPLTYIQGTGNIIPGLESEMEGKKAGDAFKVTIAPKDGYGEKRDDLLIKVTKDNFDASEPIEVGMQFQVQTQHGVHVVTVAKVEGDHVTLDGNHPLAGEVLNFDVKVVEVRDATQEELTHGHAHGESSCGSGECCSGCGGHCD